MALVFVNAICHVAGRTTMKSVNCWRQSRLKFIVIPCEENGYLQCTGETWRLVLRCEPFHELKEPQGSDRLREKHMLKKWTTHRSSKAISHQDHERSGSLKIRCIESFMYDCMIIKYVYTLSTFIYQDHSVIASHKVRCQRGNMQDKWLNLTAAITVKLSESLRS